MNKSELVAKIAAEQNMSEKEVNAVVLSAIGILQPYSGSTEERAVQRVTGTMLGATLAAFIALRAESALVLLLVIGLELVRMLRERLGRVEVEQVLSGQGLLNLHRLTHRGGECAVVGDLDSPDAPAAVSRAGLGGRCQGCAEALRMFVSAYGAEAGNLALRGMALAGIYVGGGIAPKILPAIESGAFMEAFLDKAPMTDMLARVPVKVIMNSEAGLIGAATFANDFVR